MYVLLQIFADEPCEEEEKPQVSLRNNCFLKKMFVKCILILWFQQHVNKSTIIISPDFVNYNIVMLHVLRKRCS